MESLQDDVSRYSTTASCNKNTVESLDSSFEDASNISDSEHNGSPFSDLRTPLSDLRYTSEQFNEVFEGNKGQNYEDTSVCYPPNESDRNPKCSPSNSSGYQNHNNNISRTRPQHTNISDLNRNNTSENNDRSPELNAITQKASSDTPSDSSENEINSSGFFSRLRRNHHSANHQDRKQAVLLHCEHRTEWKKMYVGNRFIVDHWPHMYQKTLKMFLSQTAEEG